MNSHQTLPVTIENGHGEKLTFLRVVTNGETETIEMEGRTIPGSGPTMHTHLRQDESFTVVQGRIGYQVFGGPEQFAAVGEHIHFPAGCPHRFWNAGTDELVIKGYCSPPNNLQYFLTALYASAKANHTPTGAPGFWDGAWLLTRYRSEFDMPLIPVFVKRFIFPIVVAIGSVLGKYRKYADAPPPLV